MNIIISVGLNGTFAQTGNTVTTDRDIDKFFDNLSKSNKNKIILYFHGGLVSEQNGIEQAEYISKFFEQEADIVCFVWKTGLYETFQQRLALILKSSFFQKLQRKVIYHTSRYVGEDRKGTRGENQALTLERIESELNLEKPFIDLDPIVSRNTGRLTERDIRNLEIDISEELDLDREISDLIRNFNFEDIPSLEVENIHASEKSDIRNRGIVSTGVVISIIVGIAKRFNNKRDHGFYPTIVEEIFRAFYLNYIGGLIWNEMKDKAKSLWTQSTETEVENSAIGTYFLKKLSSFQKENPDVAVDLIGHSAGSIIICHLIDAIHERFSTLKIRNVLFLAPACTSDLFHTHIVGKEQYYQFFRMFTMSDEFEKQDTLVSGIYTRSLLYFISGVLEKEADTPIAGLKFHIGELGLQAAKNISFQQYKDDDSKMRDINNFLSKNNRLVLSPTSEGTSVELSSQATSHGDFGKIEEEKNPDALGTTLKSLLSLISQ
jgi:Alpha/beta hydrolase of unknown function (DUF900)